MAQSIFFTFLRRSLSGFQEPLLVPLFSLPSHHYTPGWFVYAYTIHHVYLCLSSTYAYAFVYVRLLIQVHACHLGPRLPPRYTSDT